MLTHDAASATLTPELRLVAAVLAQALHDMTSRSADVRQDALRFLQDAEAMEWWTTLLDLDPGALQRHVDLLLDAGAR